MDKKSVRTSAGTMNVRTEGDGPTVLLVHGIPGSSGVWAEASRGLVKAGFRVLAPDLLGFGASDRAVSLDELWVGVQANALAHMLDALGAAPAITVGHDFGAPTSVMLASRTPDQVSSLVLAAGNPFTDTPMLRMMLRIGVGRPSIRLDPDIYLGDADQWGDRDPIFGVEQARRAADAIPNATMRIETDAGHFLPAERPAPIVETVRRRHVAATASPAGRRTGHKLG